MGTYPEERAGLKMARRRKDLRSIFKVVKNVRATVNVLRGNFRKLFGDSPVEVEAFKRKRDGSWFANEEQRPSTMGRWFGGGIQSVGQHVRNDKAVQYGQAVGNALASWATTFRNVIAPPSGPMSYWKALQGMGGMKSYDQFGFERGQQQGGRQLQIPDFESASIRAGGVGRNGAPGYDAWVRHLSGPASAEKRQFSPITRNLGGRILAMGPLVPSETRAKAAIAANGTSNKDVEEKDLLEHMRESLGVEESGAYRMGKITRGARHLMHKVNKYAMLGTFASEGGTRGALATGQMVLHGLDDAESVLNSQAMSVLAEKLAGWLTKNPLNGSKLVGALGRVMRVGGVAVQAAAVFYESYLMKWQAMNDVAAAQGSMAASAFKSGDPALAERFKQRINKNVEVYGSWVTKAMRAMKFGELESEKAKLLAQNLSGYEHLRQHPSSVGVNAAQEFSKYAHEHNMAVGDLTTKEKIQILNKAIQKGLTKIPYHVTDPATDVDLIGIVDQEARNRKYMEMTAVHRFEFLEGVGNYEHDIRSPAVGRANWVQQALDRVHRMSAETRAKIRLDGERKEREAIGMRTRRQVQNFD